MNSQTLDGQDVCSDADVLGHANASGPQVERKQFLGVLVEDLDARLELDTLPVRTASVASAAHDFDQLGRKPVAVLVDYPIERAGRLVTHLSLECDFSGFCLSLRDTFIHSSKQLSPEHFLHYSKVFGTKLATSDSPDCRSGSRSCADGTRCDRLAEWRRNCDSSAGCELRPTTGVRCAVRCSFR